MKKFFALLATIIITFNALAQHVSEDSIIGRPFKAFSTTAFCKYSSFHPSQYIVDNNWDILCVFRNPGSVTTLDSLNIPYNKSQLTLLMVGDLLEADNGKLKTKMPIFNKQQTSAIRNESKAFADSIFPTLEPKIKDLIAAFNAKGYSTQTYSLIFSYLLDNRIWAEGKLQPPGEMENHGTWSGAYWAMYDKRPEDRNGTNGYGPLKVNWTDELGYWPSDIMLLNFGKSIRNNGLVVTDEELIKQLNRWNLVDLNGHPTVPVMRVGNHDEIDFLCDTITADISGAIKKHCTTFAKEFGIQSQDEAEVIFYHEVMWDLLAIMEAKELVEKPAILKGEETGAEHFADITFIVLTE